MAKELFVYASTKNKCLAQKLQGEIDDSQIGIIADTGEFWFQDVFYPLIAVAKVAFSGSYLDLEDKPTIPSAITENTVSEWGFTKNNGTITEDKMNGKSKGTSGVVDLGTVLTEHQDISGKVDKVQGKGLSTNDFTSELKSKLENLKNYDDTKLQETLSALRREVTLIVSKNTNDSIESLEEVIEFLSGFKDDAKLHDIVSIKMDKPSQTAMLGLPNKVMTWDGNKTLMSLPIADGLDDWGKTEGTPYGYLVTDQQVKEYINDIKGSLASGLMPKETIGPSPNYIYGIECNKVYEMATAANITYNIGLKLITTTGVDVIADNEWRIRIDARNGFSGSINFVLSDGYLLRWAYPDDISSPSTPPSIAQGYIYDIRFRMIGRTLLGTYKRY